MVEPQFPFWVRYEAIYTPSPGVNPYGPETQMWRMQHRGSTAFSESRRSAWEAPGRRWTSINSAFRFHSDVLTSRRPPTLRKGTPHTGEKRHRPFQLSFNRSVKIGLLGDLPRKLVPSRLAGHEVGRQNRGRATSIAARTGKRDRKPCWPGSPVRTLEDELLLPGMPGKNSRL